ncbi:hypothetical protein J6590_059275 [Homalodisca vitripennis]|nr:hypothetical protein J6590_059275 [Homalodisca vitripennis]
MPVREEIIDAYDSLGKRTNQNVLSRLIRRAKRDFSTRQINVTMANPIYLDESLTPKRRLLLKGAREFKKTNNYKWLWVREGRIYLKADDDGPVINVKCQ